MPKAARLKPKQALIPKGQNGSATALRVARAQRLRAWAQRASKPRNSGRFRGCIVLASDESSHETARLTATRGGDTVADREKGDLKILHASPRSVGGVEQVPDALPISAAEHALWITACILSTKPSTKPGQLQTGAQTTGNAAWLCVLA